MEKLKKNLKKNHNSKHFHGIQANNLLLADRTVENGIFSKFSSSNTDYIYRLFIF
jgi:hypothetical protein